MESSGRAAGAALAAVALWATNALAAAVALNRLEVLQLLAVQYGSAAVLLGLWRTGRRLTVRVGADGTAAMPRRRLRLVPVATGVLGLTGTIFLQYWAFATAPIVGANVIAYGWPLIAAVWLAFTVRSSQTLAGIPLALLGFAGVAAIFVGHGGGSGGGWFGYLLALGSAACMAFYTVAAGRIQASTTDLLLPATICGALVAAAGSLLEQQPWPPFAQWWPAIYIGLGPMAVGYALWTYAMSGNRSERLSPIGYATPLLSTALLLATGRPLTTATLIGAALIVVCSAGVLINERRTTRHRPIEAAATTAEPGHQDQPRSLSGRATPSRTERTLDQ